jgi:aminopeptidase N
MHVKRLPAWVALLLTSLMPSIHADTYPRQIGVDALHYTFRLTLGDTSDEIAGEATVHVRFLAHGVNDLFLDLASAATGKGMIVSAVSSDGRQLTFTHRDDRLRISLPSPSRSGQATSVTIQYHGVPIDGLRLIPNIFGDRTIFSENWPNKARQWLPMIDHPYDKATGEFIVTAPAHYQVVANGLLVEENDIGNGERRTHWKQSVPIASWLYAIGVARFSVHHAGVVKGVPLQSWVFPQDRDKRNTLFEVSSRTAMEFFTEKVGPYSYEKLANVQAAGIAGATEHATAIFYGEKEVSTNRLPAWIVVHEVAHQWFGNAVTERDWDDVWLSEGFATYFALLYTEHFDGRDAFVEGLKQSRATILQQEQKMPDSPVIHRNLSDMGRVLNSLVYEKGSWTLHMLRRLIGTENFWQGIREYYRRYQNKNVSTDDFRQVMEEAAGTNLTWFFRQWLNRSGMPRLEGTWHYAPERKRVDVALTQSQTGDLFRLPLDIGLVSSPQGSPRIEHVEFAERQAMFSFPADIEPFSVVLDPETSLLVDVGSITKAR